MIIDVAGAEDLAERQFIAKLEQPQKGVAFAHRMGTSPVISLRGVWPRSHPLRSFRMRQDGPRVAQQGKRI